MKCYVQQCGENEDGPGYRCFHGEETGVKEGDEMEDDFGCSELRIMRDGKLWEYHRRVVNLEGDDTLDKEKIKEGCTTRKDNSAGKNEEWETCYCFKDLCNNKYQIPEGAKLGYGNESEED